MELSRFGGNKRGLGFIELIKISREKPDEFERIYSLIWRTNFKEPKQVEELKKVLREKLDLETK
jgi:hypothetical protein